MKGNPHYLFRTVVSEVSFFVGSTVCTGWSNPIHFPSCLKAIYLLIFIFATTSLFYATKWLALIWSTNFEYAKDCNKSLVFDIFLIFSSCQMSSWHCLLEGASSLRIGRQKGLILKTSYLITESCGKN